MKEIKRKRKKTGDIVAIELPNGKYAFYRVFENGFVGFYEQISESINELPKEERYKFIVVVYKEVLSAGKIVGHVPFDNEEIAKGPLTYIKNNLSEHYYLLIDNKMVIAKREDCMGLEKASVWGLEHVINRILNGNSSCRYLEREDFEDWEKNRERRLIEAGFNKQ